MSAFLDSVIKKLKPHHDDDFVDRANYMYTAMMFGIFAITIASKQYVGQPIQCWVPAIFKKPMEMYSESYCFVENTYFVGMQEDFPTLESDRKDREIGYYQWVPLLLIAQMVACLMPKVLYNAFNIHAGYSIEKMVDTVGLIEEDKKNKIFKFKDDHEKTSKKTTNYLAEVFNLRRGKIDKAPKNSFRPIKAVFYKSGTTKLYLLYKLLNLANTMSQVYILNSYLWPNYDLWGYGFLQDLINDRQWKESGEFPRVTFCDIEIRELNIKPVMYTFQCVLMINMFNEKVYIFIWFWLLVLSAFNAVNLVYWLINSHLDCNLVGFVRRHLSYTHDSDDSGNPNKPRKNPPTEEEIVCFTKNYLFVDGVTTLRLLESNAGEVVTADMVKNLWNDFKSKKSQFLKKPQLAIRFSGEDDPNMNASTYSTMNQMTHSTCTTSTSATGTFEAPREYTTNATLRVARQRLDNGESGFSQQILTNCPVSSV